jgi:hypothetical protein
MVRGDRPDQTDQPGSCRVGTLSVLPPADCPSPAPQAKTNNPALMMVFRIETSRAQCSFSKAWGKSADSLTVDGRFEPRHLTDLDVHITRLTHPAWSGLGQIADISNSGVRIKAPFELAAGDVVQLEVADSNLYGFVVHASLEGTAFRAGIEIQRVLMGGSDLSRVLHLALRRVLPGVPGVVTSLSA